MQATQMKGCSARSVARPFVSRVAPARPAYTSRSRQSSLVIVAAGTVSTNDFKNGLTVELEGVPYRVIEFLHVKPGKGAAFVRSKLKNCLNGGNVEKTFRAGEQLQMADLMRREVQYTYQDGDNYVFMDQETYEETRVERDDDWAKYMKEGSTVQLMFFNGKVISVEPPNFVELQVTSCGPNVKGNTAAGGSKPAVVETGATVNVPLFINEGEVIKLDTRTGEYLSRVN